MNDISINGLEESQTQSGIAWRGGRGKGLDQMLTTVPYIFTGRLRIFLLHNAALCWQVNLFRFADVIYDSSLSSKQDNLAIDLEHSLTFSFVEINLSLFLLTI